MNTHAPGRIAVGGIVLLVSGLASAAAYAWLRVQAQGQQIAAMRQSNTVLYEESSLWQRRWVEDVRQRDEQIAQMKQTLHGLSDAQQLKQQVAQTQGRLAQLEGDYESINRQKKSLEVANVGLNARIDNLTREMTKTLDDLKTVRAQLDDSQLERMTVQYTKEIESYRKRLKERETVVSDLEAQVRGLRGDASRADDGGRQQERELAALRQEKERLEAKIDRVTRSYEQRLVPVSRLRQRIRELERESREKDKQRQALEREVAQAEETRRELERKFESAQQMVTELRSQAIAQAETQRQQEQELESLRTERMQASFELQKAELRLNAQTQEMENLRQALVRVETDLSAQSLARAQMADQRAAAPRTLQETDEGVEFVTRIEAGGASPQQELSKAYALYDTAKAQVVKFSEMLMEREMELERTKQQLAAVQGGHSPGFDLARADATGDTVERARQLQAKDVELAELQQLKNGLEQQLQKREQEYQESNTLVTRLKEQMVHLSEILVARESDFLSKNREVISLTVQLDRLQAELETKQNELEQVRQRQAMTLEELAKATRLNVTLQENLVQMYKDGARRAPPANTQDRDKADALRREVEKIMGK